MRAPAFWAWHQYGVRVGAPGPTLLRARGTKDKPTSVPTPHVV